MRGFELVDGVDVPLVITEWNWNGWGADHPVARSLYAKGHAMAGFLHAMIRHGHVHLGIQSMLIGNDWDINSIRVPEEGEAFIQPTGEVLHFYQNHTGDTVYRVDVDNLPHVPQPVRLGQIAPVPALALLDVVATADNEQLYVNVINRNFDQAQTVQMDVSAFAVAPAGTLTFLEGQLDNNEPPFAGKDRCTVSSSPLAVSSGGMVEVSIPRRAIAVVTFQRTGATKERD